MSMGGVVLKDKNPDTGENENDMSVSLLVEWGTFKYFIGGDIEHPTEEELAANDLILNVDVYHSTHHGSDTSSAADLMEDMQPTVIIISNGDHGGYQHPRQQDHAECHPARCFRYSLRTLREVLPRAHTP